MRRRSRPGTTASMRPSFAHSARRRSAWPTGRRRPVRPISPKHATPARTGRAARGRGDRERDAEVGARLVDPHAAGDVDEDVGLAERDARVAPEHGDDHREPLRDRRRCRRGAASRGRSATTSAWISSRSGRVPSSAQATTEPGSPVVGRAEQLATGRRRRRGPPTVISKTPSSFVEPKRFLTARRIAVRAVAVALELEHAVDEVLEHARARRRRRPSSRGRRGTSRRPPPWRRAAAARRPRAPGATEPGAEPSSGA